MDYTSPDSIYNLLPAVYRIRDAEKGYPLRDFLRIIAGQVKIAKEDIDRLWDNFFIETCDDWIIPYIGDLVGNNPLHDIERPNRADVAKTIYYRRRKGTLPMLEELARDVTGWGCHAVEFFELLDWTQNLNHLRIHSKECVDVRDLDTMDLVNTPFDSVSHTVDVRAINQTEGWYNLRNIGFFLWRLRSYPLENVQARPVSGVGDYRYHFSPLGNPVPLFHHPEREGDETGLAAEIHVPGPIRPVAFYSASENYYGKEQSLYIITDGVEIPSQNILCKNLKNWTRPPAGKVGVDVTRGRITYAVGEEPENVMVSYYYGFSADIGGGQYERRKTFVDSSIAEWKKTVRQQPESAEEVATIDAALTDWVAKGRPKGVIQIADSGTYAEALQIELAENTWLAIEVINKQRPTLRFTGTGNLTIIGNHQYSRLILNGLLIEGSLDIQGSLDTLQIIHCTFVPGLRLNEEGEPIDPEAASIHVAEPNINLEIEIEQSIVGPLRLPHNMAKLTIRDSILDAFERVAIARTGSNDETGPPTVIERATVLGKVLVKELILSSEVIFTREVVAERTQSGCVRFSYIPRNSQTSRRFRCQPDLALTERAKELKLETANDLSENEKQAILMRVQPKFTSVHYGHPAYGQLGHHCPEEIKSGAEDGSEMGVFCHLRQPQREANLRIRLEEYLPCGLQPGFIFMT